MKGKTLEEKKAVLRRAADMMKDGRIIEGLKRAAYSKELQHEFVASIEEAYDSATEAAIAVAVEDGLCTQEDVLRMCDECSASRRDLGQILLVHYAGGELWVSAGSGVSRLSELSKRLGVVVVERSPVDEAFRIAKDMDDDEWTGGAT